MRDLALQVARERPELGLHALREYLQNYLLWLMQRVGLNLRLCFVGGTALRFLWRIERFSEDLNFSAGPDWDSGQFVEAARKIERGLAAAGYDVYLYSQGSQDRSARGLPSGWAAGGAGTRRPFCAWENRWSNGKRG